MAAEQLATCQQGDINCQCHQIIGVRDICSQACSNPVAIDASITSMIDSSCGSPSEISSAHLGLKHFFPFFDGGFYYEDEDEDDEDDDDCDNGDDSDDGSRWWKTSTTIPAAMNAAATSDPIEDLEENTFQNADYEMEFNEVDAEEEEDDDDVEIFAADSIILDMPAVGKQDTDPLAVTADCDSEDDEEDFEGIPYHGTAPAPPSLAPLPPPPPPPPPPPSYPVYRDYPYPPPPYPPPGYYYPPAGHPPGPARGPGPERPSLDDPVDETEDDCDGPEEDINVKRPLRDRYSKGLQRLVRGSEAAGVSDSEQGASNSENIPTEQQNPTQEDFVEAAIAFPKLKIPWFKSSNGERSEEAKPEPQPEVPSQPPTPSPEPERPAHEYPESPSLDEPSFSEPPQPYPEVPQPKQPEDPQLGGPVSPLPEGPHFEENSNAPIVEQPSSSSSLFPSEALFSEVPSSLSSPPPTQATDSQQSEGNTTGSSEIPVEQPTGSPVADELSSENGNGLRSEDAADAIKSSDSLPTPTSRVEQPSGLSEMIDHTINNTISAKTWPFQQKNIVGVNSLQDSAEQNASAAGNLSSFHGTMTSNANLKTNSDLIGHVVIGLVMLLALGRL